MNRNAVPLDVFPADVKWFLSHPGTSMDELRRWQQRGDIEIVERPRP